MPAISPFPLAFCIPHFKVLVRHPSIQVFNTIPLIFYYNTYTSMISMSSQDFIPEAIWLSGSIYSHSLTE